MIDGVLSGLPRLPDTTFVSARQENLETIHQHNVAAERYGTLAELRREVATAELPPRHTTLRDWLNG
jgi:GTP cyclohydrolase I/GTP cyclohydrolase-4